MPTFERDIERAIERQRVWIESTLLVLRAQRHFAKYVPSGIAGAVAHCDAQKLNAEINATRLTIKNALHAG